MASPSLEPVRNGKDFILVQLEERRTSERQTRRLTERLSGCEIEIWKKAQWHKRKAASPTECERSDL